MPALLETADCDLLTRTALTSCHQVKQGTSAICCASLDAGSWRARGHIMHSGASEPCTSQAKRVPVLQIAPLMQSYCAAVHLRGQAGQKHRQHPSWQDPLNCRFCRSVTETLYEGDLCKPQEQPDRTMLVLEPSLGSTGKLDNVCRPNPAFLASRSPVLSWPRCMPTEQLMMITFRVRCLNERA